MGELRAGTSQGSRSRSAYLRFEGVQLVGEGDEGGIVPRFGTVQQSGHLGREELTIIAPAVTHMRARGLDVSGPFPADTIFVPRLMASYDAVLAMYHDQGLPVIKHAHFDEAVNVTLGLPIIRTSVDHGTALDLAGSGHADVASLAAAVRMATTMAAHAA